MSRVHITDEMLDRLSAELRAMAKSLCDENLGRGGSINDGNRRAARDLAFIVQDIATERPMLALFADLLARHDTKASALAELTERLAA